LIKACRLLKDWGVSFHCEIVGSGPLAASLDQYIVNLGLEKTVRLRGQMPQQELRVHYLKAMLFALPCVVAANGDRDILPNVLKEAMAVGVPVVTTQLGGIEELVTHEETGLLAPAGNIETLAKSLQRLLTNAELRQRLANRARRVIEERFNLGVNFAPLRQLLCEMVEERASREIQHQKTERAMGRCA
jgi:glycosyltransferase involved in cell wall biosynthesis